MIESLEKIVETLLTQHRISSVPVSVEDIAKENNIAIGTAASNKFSGILFRNEDSQSYIAINSGESPVRQRFTIAHELGHYFLHKNTKTFIDFRDNKKNIARSPKERQANQFAACLLMPKKFLAKDTASFSKEGISQEHIQFLAKKYKVSEEAMNYRLINLHAI